MPAFSGLRVYSFRGKKTLFGLAGFEQTKAQAKITVEDFKDQGIPAKITPVLKRISGRFGRPKGGFNLWIPHGPAGLSDTEKQRYINVFKPARPNIL